MSYMHFYIYKQNTHETIKIICKIYHKRPIYRVYTVGALFPCVCICVCVCVCGSNLLHKKVVLVKPGVI